MVPPVRVNVVSVPDFEDDGAGFPTNISLALLLHVQCNVKEKEVGYRGGIRLQMLHPLPRIIYHTKQQPSRFELLQRIELRY